MSNVTYRRMRGFVLGIALLPFISACGDPDEKGEEKAGTPGPAASAPWQELLTGSWTVLPGEEKYVCVRSTVTEDLYLNSFDAINPPGTHHTLLSMGEPNAPDGVSDCTAFDNHRLSVFGSGVGTNQVEAPEGIALKIPKGTQLLLNLHLFNVGTEEIAGVSGTRVKAIPVADVRELSEGMLAGTVKLNIPPGQTTVHVGYCTMSHDATIFSVMPHMHQLGIYEKVVVERSWDDDVVLFDGPYDFAEQIIYGVPPVKVQKGDRVRVECTHKNTTDETVTWGDSSLAEMCFAGFARYPATGTGFACVDPEPGEGDAGADPAANVRP